MDPTALEALPLFPLPIVLIPGQSLPLHVFEPRYQAMVAHAMAHDKLIGLATLKRREDAMLPQAEVQPVFGVGRILGHQELPEGRSNILLRYAGRVRLIDELPLADGGFRLARVEALDEPTGPVPQAKWIRALLAQMASSSPTVRTSFERLVSRDDEDMLQVLADLALPDLADRVAFLEASKLADRAELVQRRLAERVAATLQPAGEA